MDPLSTFLALALTVAVVVVVMSLRAIGTRDQQLSGLREEHETVRKERDESRTQSRESRKEAEGLSGDLKKVRQDLKDAKKKAFKASEQVKKVEGKVANTAGWSSSQEQRLKKTVKAYEKAQTTIAGLQAEIADLSRPTATDDDAEAARVRAPASTSVADGARIRELADKVDRLQDRLERADELLYDERASARNRDRDLMTARKLAVQHERSFQVVRGQLDIARERLTEAGISLRAEPDPLPEPEPAPEATTEPETPEEVEAPVQAEVAEEAAAGASA